MAAYFLLLSQNETRGRRFVRLSAATALDWFREAWPKAAQGCDVWGAELKGHVYGLGNLFDTIVDAELELPADDAELMALLESHIYAEYFVEAEPHVVHVETNDDEVDIEYFFFDDDFLESPDALERLPNVNARDDDPYATLLRKHVDE